MGFKTALTQGRDRSCHEKPTNSNDDKICKRHNHGKGRSTYEEGCSSPRLSKRLVVVLWYKRQINPYRTHGPMGRGVQTGLFKKE